MALSKSDITDYTIRAAALRERSCRGLSTRASRPVWRLFDELVDAAARATRMGHVYAVHDRAARLVKIGFTKQLARRLNAIRTGSGRTLTIVTTFRGSRDDERALHERFGRHRIEGEWFKATPAVLKALGNLPASPTPAADGADR